MISKVACNFFIKIVGDGKLQVVFLIPHSQFAKDRIQWISVASFGVVIGNNGVKLENLPVKDSFHILSLLCSRRAEHILFDYGHVEMVPEKGC